MSKLKKIFKEKFPDWLFAAVVNLITEDIRIHRFENDWLVSHDGYTLRSPNAKHFGVYKKIFEERFESVFKIGKNDTVMDVGASIGETSVLFGEKSRHVIAIEPEPNNVRCLQYNLSKFSHEIIQKAAWNKNEKLKLFINKYVTGHSLLSNSGEGCNTGFIEVEADTLDNIYKKVGKKINFLKIDVQGAEMACLEGAETLLSETEKIVIETHLIESGSTAPQVVKFLSNRDFKFEVKKHKYTADNTFFEIVHAWK